MRTLPLTKKQKGFSLIELLVSLSIFSVVITMAVGTLLVLIDANAKAQNLQTSLTNLNFAMDSMTREIRTGLSYVCTNNANQSTPNDSGSNDTTQDCSNGGVFLSIKEGGDSLTGTTPGNDRIDYRFNDSPADGGRIERRIEGDSNSWLSLTSSDIDINTVEFYVLGSTRGDGQQPRVTIYVAGSAGTVANVDTEFDLQTTVTQRLLDI